MIQELEAMGQDRATLDAMDDQALAELYEQMKGGSSGGPPGPDTPPAGTQMAEKRTTKQVIQVSPRTLRQYVTATALAEVARATTTTRAQRIHEFCERMVAIGRLTPAQVDPHNGPVRKRLERASAIARFGEDKSELQLQMEEIEGGPALRRFGELLPAGQGGAVGGGADDVMGDVKDWVKRKHGKRA
jgi:hypothetical protein